jgi:dTDP-4-dehydrorhamnose reductase
VKVLLTGASGQVGRALQASVPDGWCLVAAPRSLLDIEDAARVRDCIERERPDWIFNAAAYTAVDRAESESEAARRVNADAAGLLASVATHCSVRVLHLSTDFVFGGDGSRPYEPSSAPSPLNVYGASKLSGEHAVQRATLGTALVVRTSWVYSDWPPNFVLRILELIGSKPELAVVSDQIGAPTWADGLARCLWSLASRSVPGGIWHWCDAGVASWYDFAVAVQEEALARGLLSREVPIRPIRSEDYPTAARRPAYSVLDTRATYAALGWEPRHWRCNLRRMLDGLAT